MSRVSNIGSQNRSFSYSQGLISSQFNQIFSKTLPPGIYDGGELERVNDYNFKIKPISVVISDSSIAVDAGKDIEGRDIAVRIRTTAETPAQNLGTPIDTTKCLVVARYSWDMGESTGTGYLDFLWVKESEDSTHTDPNYLWTTDLILGKINFYNDGSNDVIHPTDPFDYTRKSISPISNVLLLPRLKVRAPLESESQNKVYVESGFVRTGNKRISVGGLSPEITNITNATHYRTDYIYITENGTIAVEEGELSTSADPDPRPFLGRKVIAVIRRGGIRSDIRGSDITNLEKDPYGTISANTLSVEDSSEYFSTDSLGNLTIESALKQLWEKAINEIVPEHKIFRNSNGTRFEQADTQDAIVVKGRSGGVNSYKVTVIPTTLSGHRTLTLANGDTTLVEGTMSTKDQNQLITGYNEFRNSNGTRFERADNQDGIILKGRDGGSSNYSVIIAPTTLSATRNLTLADGNTTLIEGEMVTRSNIDQTILGVKTFSSLPKIPESVPSDDAHVVSKKYYDDTGVKLTGDQVITDLKTFKNSNGTEFQNTDDTDKIVIKGTTLGSTNKKYTITISEALTGDRTATFPNGNVIFLSGTQVSASDHDQTVLGHKTFRNSRITFESGDGNAELRIIPNSQSTSYYQEIKGASSLTGNRSLTLADGNTTLVTGTMATKDQSQVITGSSTFRNSGGTRFEQSSGNDSIIIKGNTNGSSNYQVTIIPSNLSGNRLLNLANGNTTLVSGTMATKDTDQTISGRKIFENNTGTSFRRASGKDAIVLLGRDSGTESRQVVITTSEALTANRIVTFPNEDVTILKGTQVTTASVSQTIAGEKTFSTLPKIPTTAPSHVQHVISKNYYDANTVKDTTSQTITGIKTFRESGGTRFEQASTQDAIVLKGRNAGTSSYQVTITPEGLSGNRGLTLANGDTTLVSGTMVSLEGVQTISGVKTFSSYPILPSSSPSNDNHPVRKTDLDSTNTSLSNHTSDSITDSNSVHGIRQGSGNNFNADKLDGADKSVNTTLSENNDSLIPSQKAVKTYIDKRLLRSAGSGQQLTGSLYTQVLRPKAHDTYDIGLTSIRYRNAYFSGGVNASYFNAISSRKKKKNIEDYENNAIEIIESLKIVKFNYKSDKNNNEHIGIIAEDSPKELLGPKGKTVSLADSIGVLFKAVQELSARVKELESRS